MYQNILALFPYKIFILMVIAVFELLIHISIYPSIISRSLMLLWCQIRS